MRRSFLAAAAGGLALVACGFSSDFLDRPAAKSSEARRPPAIVDDRPPDPPLEGHCEAFSLSYGPVTLPPATLGVPYAVHVGDWAEHDWYGSAYYASAAPVPGLELRGKSSRETLVLEGTPTELGAFDFTIEAGHSPTSEGCSIMPDPHSFHLEVTDGSDAGSEGGTDASSAPSAPH